MSPPDRPRVGVTSEVGQIGILKPPVLFENIRPGADLGPGAPAFAYSERPELPLGGEGRGIPSAFSGMVTHYRVGLCGQKKYNIKKKKKRVQVVL
jgi:hypothetical protein